MNNCSCIPLENTECKNILRNEYGAEYVCGGKPRLMHRHDSKYNKIYYYVECSSSYCNNKSNEYLEPRDAIERWEFDQTEFSKHWEREHAPNM